LSVRAVQGEQRQREPAERLLQQMLERIAVAAPRPG
jgi:hypothetical protein